MLSSGKWFQVVSRFSAAPVNHIAKHINGIIWTNYAFPVFDQPFIHGVNALKRPIAHLDDVGMTKVRIANVKVHKITFIDFYQGRSCLETHETIET